DVDLVTVVREHDRHAETAPVEIDPPQLVEVVRVIVGETDGHELGRRGTGSPRREVDRAGVGVHGGGAGCRTPALAGTTPGRAVADVGGGDLPGQRQLRRRIEPGVAVDDPGDPQVGDRQQVLVVEERDRGGDPA